MLKGTQLDKIIMSKNGIFSTVAGAAAGLWAYSTFHPEEEAMKIIVDQFEQSGAANVSYVGTQIINYSYSASDFNANMTELLHKMDFSAVPQLYEKAAETGLFIGAFSEGLGLLLRLAGEKKGNGKLDEIGKSGRIGLIYGFSRALAAKIGLNNMPYTIKTEVGNVYSLVQWSKRESLSSVDITSIIAKGNNTINYELLSLVLLGIVDLTITFVNHKRKLPPTDIIKKNYRGIKV